MTCYLDFQIDFQVTVDTRFEAIFKSLKKKLNYQYTTHFSLASKVLVVNQAFFSTSGM